MIRILKTFVFLIFIHSPGVNGMQEEKLVSGASKVLNGEPHLIIEPEKNSLNHVHVLRFEVL